MNRRYELPQELNKLGNEIIFFSLDKDDANPYHSTISKIECKKKTLYPDYIVDDIDEEIDDKDTDNMEPEKYKSELDTNNSFDDNISEKSKKSEDFDEILSNEGNERTSSSEYDVSDGEIEETYIVDEEDTEHSSINELVNYLMLSDKETIYLVGYDDDIVHLKTHLNNHFKGEKDLVIRYIDVVDLSQKMLKNLNKKTPVEKGWFTASNTPEINDLESLKNIYGNQDNKLSNVLNIFENLVEKLGEEDYLNKMDLMYNIDDLYKFIYYNQTLSIL